MPALASPDNDTFSTPPTTPGIASLDARSFVAPLTRRASRPSVLQINRTTATASNNVEIEAASPEVSRHNGGTASSPFHSLPKVHLYDDPPSNEDRRRSPHIERPMNSPCFVHSHLDQGASLTDWLRNKQPDNPQLGVSKSLLTPQSNVNASHIHEEEDVIGGSLTEQLAETAVSVREMSKQLGRARVVANIQNVLIVTKARDNRLIKLTRQLALYLMLKDRPGHSRGLTVYVDNQLRRSKRFDAQGIAEEYPQLVVPFPRRRSSSSNSLSSLSSSSRANNEEFSAGEGGQLRYWTSDMCRQSPHLFDFVVTLGGDGTVLFTSWLFQRIVPPVMPFALGSLGFLTNFDFGDHEAVLDSAIDSGIRVNLRMRFTCTVYRAVTHTKSGQRKAVKKGETGEIMMKDVEKGGWEALEGGWSGTTTEGHKPAKDKEIMCFTTRPVETFEVINDLVVDRGPSPYVSLLELFGDEHHMTTVQADGLTVSTPTGSTAYSLSAGGSLVHPEIPAILITPICPHTLSFRPMLLPDTMELRICVPFNSRSTAWASFDGRGRVELKQGDHIKVTASRYPFPTICADKQSTDWFHSISRTLKWNERERQKSFVVVEEGPEKEGSRKQESPSSSSDTELDEEDEVSEEEEDKFDITDSSPEADALLAAQQANRRRSKSRSRSRTRLPQPASGISTPGRYAGPHSHPPGLVRDRHVNFGVDDHGYLGAPSNADVASSSASSLNSRVQGNRRRSPQPRDADFDSARTPTVAHLRPRAPHHLPSDVYSPRAFAAWGHDESASDSDA
ncbi:ATP-NAD kinase-like domain-containing protein [Pterulicium gracile]|uniref:ATP-NAD kinase-like domain-containing protein n=1 Tax=Pterulicium gracile TaxID=1884261 RepID=A0A5C3QSC0_9AGAR|nr:ATP-NAD kinase-like domain-containing protein [Pterula gracilis]